MRLNVDNAGEVIETTASVLLLSPLSILTINLASKFVRVALDRGDGRPLHYSSERMTSPQFMTPIYKLAQSPANFLSKFMPQNHRIGRKQLYTL